MPFKAAKCPNCAGDIQVPDERDTAKCMYCGSDIIVREAIKLAVSEINLDNIFRLADEAANSGNHAEAYNYYTKILEADHDNYRAWFGKAISAGWQSTLANLRLPETIFGVENAMKYAPENEKEALKINAASSLDQLAMAIFHLAQENFTMHITLDTSREFSSRVQLIITVLEIASIYKPDDQAILENMILVLKADMKKYTNEITFDTIGLTESAYHDAAEKLQEIRNKLQKLNPNYNVEIPPYRKTCFIATAAYGSVMAPEVVMLRKFRDSYLNNTVAGRAFVDAYYYLSPSVAGLISKRDGLKAVTRFFLNTLVFMIKRLG